MLFNSIEFAVFFPVVTGLYFAFPHASRWMLLLSASCVFYMAFVPAYILILAVTIVIDYYAGIWIEECRDARRKRYLLVSILATIAILFFFKYFNFANTNLAALSRFFGFDYPIPFLKILLPIGLSFHTFQSLSYVIEVYRGDQKAERHFGVYALYVMFYPQLVAGPIERPQNLLHQFHQKHSFDHSRLTSGLRLMAWGLFKKVVIADRLAPYVNEVYGAPELYSGTHVALATFFFAYQIYCDFSGYSDMAIGAARAMGFELMTNFRSPYHSRSIGEFWRRWHISLSTWFRDYVYIPLGGSRATLTRWCFAILATFAVSGIWHGANWTFVVWGLLNGVYICFGRLTQSSRAALSKSLGISENSMAVDFCRILTTFLLVNLTWVLFRAETMGDALLMFHKLATDMRFGSLKTPGVSHTQILVGIAFVILLEFLEVLSKRFDWSSKTVRMPIVPRWLLYYSFALLVALFGVFKTEQFIYFQF